MNERDTNRPKYEDVEVELSTMNGNAMAIVSAASKALRRHGVPADEVNEFIADALSDDYDHVIEVVSQWVSIY